MRAVGSPGVEGGTEVRLPTTCRRSRLNLRRRSFRFTETCIDLLELRVATVPMLNQNSPTEQSLRCCTLDRKFEATNVGDSISYDFFSSLRGVSCLSAGRMPYWLPSELQGFRSRLDVSSSQESLLLGPVRSGPLHKGGGQSKSLPLGWPYAFCVGSLFSLAVPLPRRQAKTVVPGSPPLSPSPAGAWKSSVARSLCFRLGRWPGYLLRPFGTRKGLAESQKSKYASARFNIDRRSMLDCEAAPTGRLRLFNHLRPALSRQE
mgnify:CR=1 FL=1